MKPERKARHYAQALLQVARYYGAVREVNDSLQVVRTLLKTDKVFLAFFHTQRITSAQKVTILRTVLKERCHPVVAEFFGYLAEKREWHLFPQIVKVYQEQAQAALNLVSVTAYTAAELTTTDRRQIVAALEQATGKQAEFQMVVDPGLIGGIKLRIGNLFIDGSLRNRLEQLRTELLQS
jgi:F-type H+-transporting ATPase subunit delta